MVISNNSTIKTEKLNCDFTSIKPPKVVRLLWVWLVWAIIMLVFLVPLTSVAKQQHINPSDDLQQSINNATPGDTLLLSPGRYLGNFTIAKALTLRGQKGVVLDAQGVGNGVLLLADNIVLEFLQIENWGHNLTEQNAGIYSIKTANHITIQHNYLKGDGFGMWLQQGQYIDVINNTVEGNLAIRSSDRGNGIQLSSIKNAKVINNHVVHTRDGIYIISSQDNIIADNKIHDLRYGIHYMYSHSNKVINNYAYNTRAGYALMSSKQLEVTGNISQDNEDYGFLLNFITHSKISNNTIDNIWTKPENKVLGRDGKGLFVYNSAYNTISNNLIKTTEIGIHLTAGSEQTKVYGNSFIDNPIQVKYVSNKKQEWSLDSKGNYWSNYLGWDLNGDQIGDAIYEPNDGMDTLLWQYPEMKLLMDSPAVLILRWAQKQFPVLKPPGVKDSFPLMESPHAVKNQATAVKLKTNLSVVEKEKNNS